MNKIKFLKNYQLVFAIVLILFIPISLFLYTHFLIKRINSNLDYEFRNKATLALNIAKQSVVKYWPDVDLMQQEIKRIAIDNSDIKALDIIVKKGDEFEIVAGLSNDDIGKKLGTKDLIGIAWQENFVAFKTNTSANSSIQTLSKDDLKNNKRFQMIMKTFTDIKGKKVGIISMKISLEDIDSLNRDLILRSWVELIMLIIIILLIIATNFKLFNYVVDYQRLQEADVMKDEFISIASHELRAPLTAIKGFTSMTLEVLDSKKSLTKTDMQIDKFSHSVLSSSERLGVLVEDMLDVSRIAQGRMKFNITSIKLKDVIDDVVDQFLIPAKNKNLYLKVEKFNKNIKVLADIDRLKQVVINIVSNSVKYTAKGGIKIKVSIDENKKSVNIRVKDTGFGMNSKERERLFQKFYRVQTEHTKGITGTGLGLWLSKEMMRIMKGDILVDSIKDEGSEFTINIPSA